MLGKLDEMQINNLLVSQTVGRIGCTDGEKPYITPVTYAFDGENIIGQTVEGLKLNILRQNPNVCFEVDRMTDMANWQSVVVSGTFHELTGKEAEDARNYLFNHVLPLMTSATIHPHQHETTGNPDDSNRIKPVMYQIRIKERSGRFEKQ